MTPQVVNQGSASILKGPRDKTINIKQENMRIIVLFALLLVAFGFRHTHKSQYDLGYEAGMQDALHDADEDSCGPRFRAFCDPNNDGTCDVDGNALEACLAFSCCV